MTPLPALESGVSLMRYAHATAALADGFAEPEALDLAGIPKGNWRPARLAWLQRIGGSGPDSKDFTDYQKAYADAEDAFGRSVGPIDKDLAAWLSFLALCEKSSNLGELLEKLALRTSDLSRLSRGWKRRFEGDPKLEARIPELRKKPLPEVRTLTLGKSKAVALPLSDSDAEPTKAVEKPLVAPPSPPDEVPLDRYAQLRSDIDRGDAVADVLALFRVDASSYARADAYYRAAFEKDALLAGDFRVLKAHADKTFRQRSQTALAAPPRQEVTPAAIEVPPPSVRTPDAGLDARIVVSPAAATPLPPPPMARRPAPATLDMPTPTREKGTLPFKTPTPGAKPPESQPPSQSGDIFAIAAQMKAKPRDAMTGTVEGGIATPKPLPFATKKKAAPATVAISTPVAPSAATPFKSQPAAQTRGAPVAPPIDPALSARKIPPRRQGAAARALLTLEQHATMHAELGVGFPLAQVFGRYGLDASLREEVDEHYRLSFTRDPRVRAAWDRTYRAATTWMTAPR